MAAILGVGPCDTSGAYHITLPDLPPEARDENNPFIVYSCANPTHLGFVVIGALGNGYGASARVHPVEP
jgi:hypothetical protein